VADIKNAPIATDHHVLRRDTQMEGFAQRAVVEHDRHAQAHLVSILAHFLDTVIETHVDGDHRHVRASLLVGALQMRHLLAARHAPCRPEF
jgi:phosphatidate phosphatase APP1